MKKPNIIKLTVLSCAILMISNASFAKTTNFTIIKKNVSFDLPNDWQSIDHEIGIPLKLLSPLHDNRRAVILFVPIDLKDEKLTMGDKKEALESYKMGRLSWLQTFQGKSISFLPVSTYTIKDKKIDVFQFGHLYNFDNANFEEKSYYLRCKNQTFHMKTLIQIEHVGHWGSIVKKITDSFNCE
jgi:hypothetical protein